MDTSFLHPARTLEAAHVYEGMRIADFSAGAGFFTRAAARLVGERGVVWAVDANRELLPRLRNLAEAEGLHNVEVVCGNVEQEEGSHLPAHSFDMVLLANTLFAAGDRRGVLREVARVLKPEGRALLVDWSDSHGGLGPHQEHVVTQAEAKEMCSKNGFEYVQDVPAGAFHWGFLVRKKRA